MFGRCVGLPSPAVYKITLLHEPLEKPSVSWSKNTECENYSCFLLTNRCSHSAFPKMNFALSLDAPVLYIHHVLTLGLIPTKFCPSVCKLSFPMQLAFASTSLSPAWVWTGWLGSFLLGWGDLIHLAPFCLLLAPFRSWSNFLFWCLISPLCLALSVSVKTS